MHDEIGHLLTGLKLILEMGARVPAEEVGGSIAQAQMVVNALMVQTRKLSLDLRPATLDHLGLLSAFLRHIKHYTSQTQVQVAFRHSGLEGRRFAPEMETVVGETGNGREALAVVKQLQPDVLVLDLMRPSLNGLEVARQLGKNVPHTGIVSLSMSDDEGFVLEALAHGVLAYVLKDSSSAELVQAVREAAAGRRYLSPPLSDRAIEAYQQLARAGTLDRHETLSTREREVLQLSAEGHTSSEIAARLGISTRTAETHRYRLMHKLHFHSQADLIRYALQRGIIPMNR